MRTPRRLALLAITTTALAASMASPAAATEPIEVVDEPSGGHCPSLAAGGCPRHGTGEFTLRTHFFGVEAQEARCRVEVIGMVDEDGIGQVTTANVTNGGHGETNCSTVSPPCIGSLPWPATAEETAANTLEDHLDVCIDPSEFLTCSGEFDSVGVESGGQGSAETQQSSATDNRIGSAFCEIDLSGSIESAEVHVRHI